MNTLSASPSGSAAAASCLAGSGGSERDRFKRRGRHADDGALGLDDAVRGLDAQRPATVVDARDGGAQPDG